MAAKIFLKLHAHAFANKQHAPNTILFQCPSIQRSSAADGAKL